MKASMNCAKNENKRKHRSKIIKESRNYTKLYCNKNISNLANLKIVEDDGGIEEVISQKNVTSFNLKYFTDVKCRKTQVESISLFLESRIQKNTGGAIFISGPPGAGKTFLMQHLITDIDKMNCKIFNPVIYINCLACLTLTKLIQQICTEMKIRNVNQSIEDLRERFSKKMSSLVLLVIDEADHFHKQRNVEMLIQLFEIAILPESSLVLFGLSNAIDLYDKFISSTLEHNRSNCINVKFPPYEKDELIELLQSNVDQMTFEDEIVFEKGALVWCANKFSLSSGDFRDAIHACELAVEAARRNDCKIVRISDLSQIVMAATSTSISEIHFYKLPLYQRLVASVIGYLSEEVGKFHLLEVFQLLSKLCTAINEPIPSDDEFWYNVDSLVDQGIINLNGKKTLKASVSFTLQRMDFKQKIEANPFLKFVHSVLCDIKL